MFGDCRSDGASFSRLLISDENSRPKSACTFRSPRSCSEMSSREKKKVRRWGAFKFWPNIPFLWFPLSGEDALGIVTLLDLGTNILCELTVTGTKKAGTFWLSVLERNSYLRPFSYSERWEEHGQVLYPILETCLRWRKYLARYYSRVPRTNRGRKPGNTGLLSTSD